MSKTASLLSAACGVGAWSTSNDHSITDILKIFGEKAGIAFQIKDDLFDYGSSDIGKPTGNDLKEKKLTLPLIYTLNNVTSAKRSKIIYIIKNESKKKDRIKYVLDEVNAAGGIKYAEEKMELYKNEALQILQQFPESDVRRALEELVNYTTGRKY